MIKSMHSGISGMKSTQIKMDVVGNNVANATTTSFKKENVHFKDALSEMMIDSKESKEKVGGVNPAQTGIGTTISGISKNMMQGNIQKTGIDTDLVIDGPGFFMVDLGNGQKGYTRDGSFNIDSNGQLVTAQGYKVMCITENHTIDIDLERYQSFSVDKDGGVYGMNPDGTKEWIDSINRVTFGNPQGLEKVGDNIYIETENSGQKISDSELAGNVVQGAIEMSNVDLSEEFTEMIVATRAFQAASKVITTSDELLQEIANLKR